MLSVFRVVCENIQGDIITAFYDPAGLLPETVLGNRVASPNNAVDVVLEQAVVDFTEGIRYFCASRLYYRDNGTYCRCETVKEVGDRVLAKKPCIQELRFAFNLE
jgi:hypothetical protein